jgi:signal transduction histidine kinase
MLTVNQLLNSLWGIVSNDILDFSKIETGVKLDLHMKKCQELLDQVWIYFESNQKKLRLELNIA